MPQPPPYGGAMQGSSSWLALHPRSRPRRAVCRCFGVSPMSEPYANIREILGSFIGKRIVDITQHDEEEFRAGEESYVMLLFDDGNFLKFPVTDLGFDLSEEKPAAPAVPGEEVAGKEE